MKFNFEITIDNDAFRTEGGGRTYNGSEIARLLRESAEFIDGMCLGHGDINYLKDTNGNTVGSWCVKLGD